ncbi:MAG: glycosyltransferase family 2 protein [Elusimicrobiota bacterium]|nr:glycosyltransferase family 2 protein [Elusimicrobiota bacterium]
MADSLKKPDISIVVPCLNEEESLEMFYTNLNEVVSKLLQDKIIETSQIIFVDDGSTDSTSDILRRIACKDSKVGYIIFSRNFGKEAAMLAGLRKSQGKYSAILDADGQHPPSLILQMFPFVSSKQYDCAGAKRTRKGDSLIHKVLSHLFYGFVARIGNLKIIDGGSDFRLMSRQYVDALLELNEYNRFSKGIFHWIGFKTKWIEYENILRTAGISKWTYFKLFSYSLNAIIMFSAKPLIFASLFGIILSFLSSAFALFIAIRKISYSVPIDGWAFTICIILFCCGIQIFTIGILGQYISKIFEEVKHRPHYIVKEENK